MNKFLIVFGLLMVTGCCYIGPNDHPDGVSGYVRDCYNVMSR